MNPVLHAQRISLLALAILPLVGAADSTDSMNSLLRNSPFETRAAPRIALTGSPEFRGVLREGDVWLVSLYCPDTKMAQWIAVPGSASGVEVESYNKDEETVLVLVGARELRIPLKDSHIARVDARDENEKQWRSPLDGRT